ncbi:MAG TPA: hypothetical protein VI603_05250 [Saprospiraceae bacterium]|nr:hypothetical protein [Saprospiraceae bacterium]
MFYTKFFAAVGLIASMTSVAIAQNVGIGTLNPDSILSIQNKLEIGGGQGDIIFTDDQGSITFPATALPNSSMISMFSTGTTNADRMVIAHSPASSTWGLQYQDVGDKFQFLGAGVNVATFDLLTRRVGIGTSSPASQLHFFSSVASNIRFEGPNNFFDFYSTNSAQLNGMRFYDNGTLQGGMFYDADDDFLYFSQNATVNGLLIDLSSSRKLAIATSDFSADHQVAIGGNVHILSGDEASLTTHGYLQTGSTTGANLIMDNNEIAARNNGVEAPLFLQPNQGNVVIGSTSDWPATLHVANVAGEAGFRVQIAGATEFIVDSDGAVMINTASNKKPGYELNVDGQIVAEEVLVQNSVNWPDYVFEEDYSLRYIEDVEAFIRENKHLPDVPSAAQIEADGINLGEMDKTLLRKIEELTLYMIQQAKDIDQLKQENAALKQAVKELQE